MISSYAGPDNWTPTINKILDSHPYLNDMDLHISINVISFDNSKKFNLLVLQESPAFLNYENILNFVKTDKECLKYYKVYSCIKELQHYPIVEYIHPSNISWINTPTFFPKKNKMISMISSTKNFLSGHKFRINVLNSVKDIVDVYGRGFNEITTKEEGLLDYHYSIAIENDDTDNYFSEKLIDCFMTCTIPIYWGSNYAYTVFNPNGIINLKNYSNFRDIKNILKQQYYDNLSAIEENYFIAQKENRSLSHTLKTILIKLYNEHYNK